MNFKVGDKVKLKEGLKVDKFYYKISFRKKMIFKGVKTILETVEGDFFVEDMPYWYEPEMLELVHHPLTIQQIIDRNYQATVKRGLIKPDTLAIEFIYKINDELNELTDSYTYDENDETFDEKELADIALVCFAFAKHRGIDLLKVMEEKTIFNEQRED